MRVFCMCVLLLDKLPLMGETYIRSLKDVAGRTIYTI